MTLPGGSLARRLSLLVAGAVTVAACGTETSVTKARDAGVYAAVIESVAPEPPVRPGASVEELERVVFVGPHDDETTLSLEVQADVVDTLDEFATVRFVDDESEAINEADELMPVRERGVLLLVGSVPLGRSPTVEVVRYVDRDERARFRVTAEREDERWSVVGVEERPRR